MLLANLTFQVGLTGILKTTQRLKGFFFVKPKTMGPPQCESPGVKSGFYRPYLYLVDEWMAYHPKKLSHPVSPAEQVVQPSC